MSNCTWIIVCKWLEFPSKVISSLYRVDYPGGDYQDYYWGILSFSHWNACKDWVRVNYSDVIMSAMSSQITGISTVYSTVFSGADKMEHHSPCLTGLCEGNSPVTGEFPSQRASNAENVSDSWRLHGNFTRWPLIFGWDKAICRNDMV